MIAHQLTLIRREIWEHPAIWVSPLVIALIVSMLTLTGQVSVSAFGEAVDLAIVGAQNADEVHRAAIMTGALTAIASIFAFGAWIVMIFYSLDALYAERKDKSILFWRSLPITDAETVVSKLLTALFVIPVVTVVVVMATHLLVLVLTSIWVKFQGGQALHLIWGSARLGDIWAACVACALLLPLWMSPLIGWFLFVSTLTKRAPFLTAVLPILLLPMLEKMLPMRSSFFIDAIYVRTFQPPLFDLSGFERVEQQIEEQFYSGLPGTEGVSLLKHLDVAGYIASPSLWLGMVVCGIFVVGAIYVRRYRDESY